MDINKILGTIEKHRMLTSASSMPFVLDINGDGIIAWFYYNVNETENEVEIAIDKIYYLKGEQLFMFKNVSISVKESLQDFEEPVVSEDEYLNFLEKAHQLNKEEVFQMLSKTVVEPILRAYREVERYCTDKGLEDASHVAF